MKFNVLVGEVMTREIKRIDSGDTIEKVAKIMRDERIGSVIVMGEKSVKGIVTTRDVVYKHVASKHGSTVKDIMSTNLITIAPSATVEEAARIMIKNSIEKLPVFDRGRLVGIITTNDILRVEPAVVELLLEKFKLGSMKANEDEDIAECESCGNFSDDIQETDGSWLCADCRMEK